mgnify:CR=1 FL=1
MYKQFKYKEFWNNDRIKKALKELTNGYYPDKDNSVIIDAESGNVFDVNITVKETKMINGSKIILL